MNVWSTNLVEKSLNLAERHEGGARGCGRGLIADEVCNGQLARFAGQRQLDAEDVRRGSRA